MLTQGHRGFILHITILFKLSDTILVPIGWVSSQSLDTTGILAPYSAFHADSAAWCLN
jgi:hypothetical protein